MKIAHIAAEAYPISKSGGLGDVMGSLPKYLNGKNDEVHLIVPDHQSEFVKNHEWEQVYEHLFLFGNDYFDVKIFKEKTNELSVNTYLVHIPYLFPRESIYGYSDDASRFLLFQIVVLTWLNQWEQTPDIIHCHDHHTGYIPFLCKNGLDFKNLNQIPTVFTIHNGEYTGASATDLLSLFPRFDNSQVGFLEYDGVLNPMISAVKCAYRVTTVSKGYLGELAASPTPLGKTISEEYSKCSGILNGIDEQVWSPVRDKYLSTHYNSTNFSKGKFANKKELLEGTLLDKQLPLFCFIGRMVLEKGADFLVHAIDMYLNEKKDANFFIIGSGNPDFMRRYQLLYDKYPQNVQVFLGYNEALARKVYASSDFLLMPSRVEPCGLNQMYAMHYGTIPIVRLTGGLKDTVKPIEDDGNGFTFYDATAHEVYYAIKRAMNYREENDLKPTIKKDMKIDFSWRLSADKYLKLYQSLL